MGTWRLRRRAACEVGEDRQTDRQDGRTNTTDTKGRHGKITDRQTGRQALTITDQERHNRLVL